MGLGGDRTRTQPGVEGMVTEVVPPRSGWGCQLLLYRGRSLNRDWGGTWGSYGNSEWVTGEAVG